MDPAGTPVETEPESLDVPIELRMGLEQMLVSNKLDLPMLPEVASQTIQASMDENCDLKKLTTLIQRDQSMTSHLLRLANSALYGGTVKIVSVQQALSRLGLSKIREIALVVSCETRVFRVDGFELAVRTLFRHSLAAGAFAQRLAKLRRWNVEEAFLCGMLHDVGRPVLLQALSDIRREKKLDVPREVLMTAATEYHCAVGSLLVAKWQLPARLAEVIVHHHDPEHAPTAGPTAMMTNLADDLAHFALGDKPVTENHLRAHPMVAGLNIYPAEMDALIAQKDLIVSVVGGIT